MNLSAAVEQDPVVRRALDAIIPADRPILVSQRVAMKTLHPQLVGTAFDYAVRFELQRLYPHAIETAWVAEAAATNRKAAEIVKIARAAQVRYRQLAAPGDPERLEMIVHALLLAQLDEVYRSGVTPDRQGTWDPTDAEEIERLLIGVPWHQIGGGTPLHLNPVLSHPSCGLSADGDVINGTRLVELKTSKAPRVKKDLRQLLGYLILCRGTTVPAIEELAIYYARHRDIWVIPVSKIVGHPKFLTCERILIERFGRRT